MYRQKVISKKLTKKLIFVGTLKTIDEKGSGSDPQDGLDPQIRIPSKISRNRKTVSSTSEVCTSTSIVQ
jgi:hypothetical protein